MAALTSYTLLKKLAFDKLKRHFPLLPGWFSEEALQAESDLYKLLDAFAGELAEFKEATKDAKVGTFLLEARGAAADAWGEELEMPRRASEASDEIAYTQRMHTELLRPRDTQQAIVDAVVAATGLRTEVRLPWQTLDFRSRRTPDLAPGKDPVYGASGRSRYSSSYHMAAVIDVVTWGYSVLTHKAVEDTAMGGIKPYFTVIRQFAPLPAPTLNPTPSYRKEVRKVMRQRLYPAMTVRSGGEPLSGRRLGKLMRQRLRQTPVTAHYNYLLPDSVLTFDDLAGFSWAEVLAGPIAIQPRPTKTVVADGP